MCKYDSTSVEAYLKTTEGYSTQSVYEVNYSVSMCVVIAIIWTIIDI